MPRWGNANRIWGAGKTERPTPVVFSRCPITLFPRTGAAQGQGYLGAGPLGWSQSLVKERVLRAPLRTSLGTSEENGLSTDQPSGVLEREGVVIPLLGLLNSLSGLSCTFL